MAYSTIQKGSKHDDVKTWQNHLKSKGYDIGSAGADGIFGEATDKATRQYQADRGLTVDGIVGANTWGSMDTDGTTTKDENAATNGTPTLNGVDQATMDKMNSTFTESGDTTAQKDKADSYLGAFEEIASQKDIVDQSTKDAMNQKFEVSDAYKQAMEFTNAQLEQLSTGKTSYTDQIKDLMSQIQNREDFEYDVDKDQLFQQALSSAMKSGQTAMQDTIGQASALTGGYGSTYATSAGNQSYNQFIEDAYNNLPEYYQMALEAYQMEGDEMYRQLDMLNTADANEYQRLYNSWDANFKNAQNIWNQDFSTWEAGVNQAINSANFQLAEHSQLVDNAYNLYAANMDMYESMYAKEYQSWSDSVAQAQQYASMLNTDYWNQTNFDESVRQFNETYEQTERWNQADMNYKYASLDEQKRQFNYSIGDTNNDGVVDETEQATLNKGSISTDDIEVDPTTGEVISIKGYNMAGTTPTVSGFKTGDGKNFEVTIGDNSYKVQNGGKVTRQGSIDRLNDPTKTKSYGNLRIYENKIYIKSGNDYYRVEGRPISASGYNDLLMALTK